MFKNSENKGDMLQIPGAALYLGRFCLKSIKNTSFRAKLGHFWVKIRHFGVILSNFKQNKGHFAVFQARGPVLGEFFLFLIF